MQLDRHPHSGGHDLSQELHVTKDPLVSDASDSEVTLEKGMEAKEEELDSGQERVRGCSQGSATQKTQCQAKRDQAGVLGAIRNGFTSLSTVDDPGEVDVAKGGPGDARGSVIKVLVNVHIEKRIQIHELLVRGRGQGLGNGIRLQPLFQLWRSNRVVNDALKMKRKSDSDGRRLN